MMATKKDLQAHIAREHPHIKRNFGQHWHRATKRDLEVAHVAWHEHYEEKGSEQNA